MKKTLIALAALAATGATLAQSSVTIYGRMDLGSAATEVTTNNAGVVTTVDTDSMFGAQNQRTGSRLGFRGTEDLGGGLRANFVYELGINPDRATTGNAETRLANLSLTGGFGTVVIGTFMNAFDTARGFSPATVNAPGGDFLLGHRTGNVGAAAGSGDLIAGIGEVRGIDGRSQNAIAYISPVFNGFTFSAGFVNESVQNSGAGALTDSDVSAFTLNLRYAQGPLSAQFAFGNVDLESGTAALRNVGEVENIAFGMSYNLGFVVPSFVYEQGELSRSLVGGASGNGSFNEFNAWELGARFPMGAFAPYITFGEGEISQRGITGATVSTDTSSWQIGTTYNLSTRTWVYAAFGEVELERTGWSQKTDGYRIGLVHTF